MALQDLTPQLRTRLSRIEQAVGWFVMLALGLLAFGFVYYVYHTAERKGWFKIKAPYYTFADRATGLKVGDPVELMGFDVGQITRIDAQPPFDPFNVYVQFEIKEPYYGYLWTLGSRAKLTPADLLGKRVLEVTKGTAGYPTYLFHPLSEVSLAEARSLEGSRWLLAQDVYAANDSTHLIAEALKPLTNLTAIAAAGHTNLMVLDPIQTRKFITAVWNDKELRYDPFTPTNKPYWLHSDESPAVTERLEKIVSQVEHALPNILNLTNQLSQLLSGGVILASNLNLVAQSARPAVSNLAIATANLDHPGALGDWLLPTNTVRGIEATLGEARVTMAGVNTNLSTLVENLGRSLDNLANITSNLDQQVAANTNLVKAVSDTIIHADQFMQGLKSHWLLRSAFKSKDTNAPAISPQPPLRSPKAQDR